MILKRGRKNKMITKLKELKKLLKEAKREQKASKSNIYQNWITETEKIIKGEKLT